MWDNIPDTENCGFIKREASFWVTVSRIAQNCRKTRLKCVIHVGFLMLTAGPLCASGFGFVSFGSGVRNLFLWDSTLKRNSIVYFWHLLLQNYWLILSTAPQSLDLEFRPKYMLMPMSFFLRCLQNLNNWQVEESPCEFHGRVQPAHATFVLFSVMQSTILFQTLTPEPFADKLRFKWETNSISVTNCSQTRKHANMTDITPRLSEASNLPAQPLWVAVPVYKLHVERSLQLTIRI